MADGAPSLTNAERAAALAMQGWTISDIAEEMQTTYGGARSALFRAGAKALRAQELTVRQRAEAMRPADAVNYLLGVIENVLCLAEDATSAREELARFGRFTGMEARVLRALLDRAPNLVTREQLFLAMYFDRVGDPPVDKIVDVYVCKIRAKLRGARIETVWGDGWRLILDEVGQ